MGYGIQIICIGML